MKIVIFGGYYATNIGNAFYDIGAKYVLNKCFGDNAQIISSSDKMQVYWSDILGDSQSIFDHTPYFASDYVVLLGPVFEPAYIRKWVDTFRLFCDNKIRIVFMSAGASKYDECESTEVHRLLEDIHLYALFSRDTETYNLYKDLFEYSYDGICCALYCNEYSPKIEYGLDEYVVMNFDNCEEPLIRRKEAGRIRVADIDYDLVKKKPFSRPCIDERLEGGQRIIRTIHSVLPEYLKNAKISTQKYFVSDVPYDYLNLYSNAMAVITNRVHAAVTSIAYGTPVMLTNCTPRGNILKRIGCEEAYKGLYVCEKEYIDEEKNKLEEAIKEILD